ncbi:MAG: PilZ domain-containing protein [Spirochaetes bacterium]|nr:PilZ domain-containing protein [Spirochaetota bacterium]
MENLKGPHDNIIKSLIDKEFLYKSIVDNNIPVTIYIKNNVSFDGFIISYDRFSITIKHNSNLPLSPFQKIQVSFFFRENRHIFESSIKNIIDSKTFSIKNPEMIFRNPKRKYQRITIDELSHIQIFFKDVSVQLNFPETEKFCPFPYEKFKDKKLDTVENLLKNFKQKMSVFSKNKIVMLRDKQPNTLEEFLIIKTGKSFYIPNVNSYFPDTDLYDRDLVIVKPDLIEYWKLMGTEVKDPNSQINSLLKIKESRGIYSELFFPVIYKKYVISYIYIMNQIDKKQQIPFNIIPKLEEFGKLMLATLIQYKYFEKLEEKSKQTELIDLSAGGLQFGTIDKTIIDNINIDDNIKISFSIKGQYFYLEGIIRRKYQFENKWYYGVQFINYPLETQQQLEKLLYN